MRSILAAALWACAAWSGAESFAQEGTGAGGEAGKPKERLDRRVLIQWGFETLVRIEKDLAQPGSGLYAEYGTPDGKRGGDYGKYSFVWPASFQLRALAAAARVEPRRFQGALIRFADALDRYWTVRSGVGGYMVLPGNSERFYDDNAWMVLGMIETAQVTGRRKYLNRAAETLAFIAGGEKKTPGGGIRQHEDKPGATSVCTTAPATVGALRLYRITKNGKVLEAAERWYAWLTSKEVGIQDPADGLYDDQAAFVGGKWKVRKGKRAYNSALPLQANVLLYQIRGDDKYLKEAQRMAESAIARWIQPSGALKETGQWGGSDLCDALLDLYEVDRDTRWLTAVHRVLRFLHEKARDPGGRYGEYWHQDRRHQALEKFHLLYMAPVARAYWRAAAAETPAARPGRSTEKAHERK